MRAVVEPTVGQSVADVAERLMWEHGGSVPLDTISAIVLAAARDLAGEVPMAALAEMLYRLARQRLIIEPQGGVAGAVPGAAGS